MHDDSRKSAWRRLRQLAVVAVVTVGVAIPIYLGRKVKQAYDLSLAFSSSIIVSREASVFLGDEITAGRPLPSSEAEFVVAFGRYLEQQRSGWPVEQSVAEGWIRYRPPVPGEPLQSDPCADDFVLWSVYIDCDSFRYDAACLVDAIERASRECTGPED